MNKFSAIKQIAQAQKGKQTPAQKQIADAERKATAEKLTNKFFLIWVSLGGPELKREVRFAPPKDWRFDYLHEETGVAVEIDGGIWNQGGHTRGKGFISNRRKDNVALTLGLIPYHLAGDEMINSKEIQVILDKIKEIQNKGLLGSPRRNTLREVPTDTYTVTYSKKAVAERVKKQWAKVSPEERSAHARKMAIARHFKNKK